MRSLRARALRTVLTRLAVVAAISTLAAAAVAGVPATLTHQGRLFDASGAPLGVTVAVQFSIYGAATGGAPLWTETHQLTLDAGYYSVALGSTASFGAGLFDGSPRYLGIKVGTDAEMSPRAQIASEPYALVAGDAVGDIHPTSVTVNGQVIIDSAGHWVGSPTGLVGPAGAAGATGAAGVQGPAGPQGPAGAVGATGAAGVQGPAGAAGATGAAGVQGPAGPQGPAGALGATGPQGPAGAQGVQGAQGSAGAQGPAGAIGATGPQGPAGTLSGGSASFLTRWVSATAVGNSTIFDNGSIGIGTTAPAEPLDVAGAIRIGNATTCTATQAGAIRWTGSTFDGCNGTAWITLGGTAVVATCTDGIKNGAETAIDCGGGTCSACATGKACLLASDCASGVCTGNVCQTAAIGYHMNGSFYVSNSTYQGNFNAAGGFCTQMIGQTAYIVGNAWSLPNTESGGTWQGNGTTPVPSTNCSDYVSAASGDSGYGVQGAYGACSQLRHVVCSTDPQYCNGYGAAYCSYWD
jgi:hypothetical protein